MGTLLTPHFFLSDDVVALAKDLLGKWLITEIDGVQTGGIITETEAYRGSKDKASHAYNNRRTPRTEVLFKAGGCAYVYFCYGMHHLFNIVTNIEGVPHAVLVRAIAPTIGIEAMQTRRKKVDKTFTVGPGKVCQALGITKEHTGLPLSEPPIWIEDRGTTVAEVESSPRIGIDYAEEHAELPWRFFTCISS